MRLILVVAYASGSGLWLLWSFMVVGRVVGWVVFMEEIVH